MNKVFATSVSALLATSASYAQDFNTWLGADGLSQVITGLDNGSETSGYWFSENDDGDGGESRVVWPVEPDNELGLDSLAPVIENCGGVCGTADLQKGTLTYQPFVTLGFNVAGEPDSSGTHNADASDWGGICITYQSTAAPTLELGLGDFDATIGYANPAAYLPKSTAGRSEVIPWNDFKQPSWYKGTTKISGEEAATQLVSIKFKIQAAAGAYDFKICAIGPYNGGTCPTTCDNIITNQTPTIIESPTAIEDLVYNGERQTLIKAGKVENGTFLYKHAIAEDYSDALPSATEIGDYTIYFMVKGNNGYNNIAPSTLKVSIKEPASSSSEKSSSSSTQASSSSVNENSSSSAKILSSSSVRIQSSSSSAPASSSSSVKSSSSSTQISSSSAKINSSSSSAPTSSSSVKDISSSSKDSKQGFVSAVTTSPIKTILDHNELHINTQIATELKVNVFDVQGNLKMQYRGKAARSHLVSLKNLNQGTYLVQITSGIKTQIQQVVIK